MNAIPKKVMLAEEFDDGASLWRVPCDCLDPEHDIKLWFEVDEDGFGSLNLETQVGWHPRYHDTWFKRVKRRIVSASAILFKGHYTLNADVILQNDGVEGLRYAVNTGADKMKKHMAKQKATSKKAK